MGESLASTLSKVGLYIRRIQIHGIATAFSHHNESQHQIIIISFIPLSYSLLFPIRQSLYSLTSRTSHKAHLSHAPICCPVHV
jgi:hypothetical protein